LLNHTLQVIQIEWLFGQVDHVVAVGTDDADIVDCRNPLLTGVAPECFQMVNDSAALRHRTVEFLELETAAVAVQAIFSLGFFSEFGVAGHEQSEQLSLDLDKDDLGIRVAVGRSFVFTSGFINPVRIG